MIMTQTMFHSAGNQVNIDIFPYLTQSSNKTIHHIKLMLFIWITLFCSFICIRSLNFSFLILVKALSIISLNLVLSMYILYKYKIKNNLRIRNLCKLFSSKKVLCISFLWGFSETVCKMLRQEMQILYLDRNNDQNSHGLKRRWSWTSEKREH